MKTKQLLLNAPLRGFPRGAVVVLGFENDVAVDPYWRARLADARRDGCVEIVTGEKPKVKKPRETKVTGPDETKVSTKEG